MSCIRRKKYWYAECAHRTVRRMAWFAASWLDGIFQALIERHHDVAAERELDFDGGFGREQMRVAIQVRAEQHAFFRDLAQIAQAENLESARNRSGWRAART